MLESYKVTTVEIRIRASFIGRGHFTHQIYYIVARLDSALSNLDVRCITIKMHSVTRHTLRLIADHPGPGLLSVRTTSPAYSPL